MKVIVDANVAIAAAASRGLCEALMELCLEHHRLVLCEGILTEIEAKLRDKIKVAPSVVAEYVRMLAHNAQILNPEDVSPGTCRDPNDLMILGLVAPGHVEAIITGDKDLLVLKQYKTARIMTPRSFWESNKKGT